MRNGINRKWAEILPAVLMASWFGGCVGSQHEATLDAVSGATGMAFVEGYIEFAGPQSKWAGPTTVVLQVTAREGGHAELQIAPQFFRERAKGEVTTTGRRPAAEGLSVEYARERLNELANVMEKSSEAEFRGCLYPVRARLLRADGGIVERQGCRSSSGWTKVASDTVSQLISAWVGGSPAVHVSKE